MKIYLASLYSKRPAMAVVADYLKSKGHEVTARWVYGGEDGLDREGIAQLDYDDVSAADVCLSFSEPYGSYHKGGGRHVEFGLAYAMGKQCALIGERENVFHHLPGIKAYPDLKDWLAVNEG